MKQNTSKSVSLTIKKVLLSKAINEARDRNICLTQVFNEALCIRYNLDPIHAVGRKINAARFKAPAPVIDTEQDWRYGVDFLYYLWENRQGKHKFNTKEIEYLDSEGIPTNDLPKE